MPSQLNNLQRLLLDAFFEIDTGFFLSGGAALCGYHLGHRRTEDLDLFVTSDRIDVGERALRTAVSNIDGTMENVISSPDFRRFLIQHETGSVVVDLVFEKAFQGNEDKLLFGRIRVDPPDEIFANKLCTLLSRSEIRDIVDVIKLEQAGLDLGSALNLAQKKDSGLTPAQLSWVVSQIEIGDDAKIPSDLTPTEVRAFLSDFQKRLRTMAFPK